MFFFRKLLEKKLENLDKHYNIYLDLKQLFISSFDKDTLDNLYDYCEFIYSLNPELDIEEQIIHSKIKRPLRKSYIREDIKEKILDFVNFALLPVEKFIDNLKAGTPLHTPSFLNVIPESMAETINDPKIPLLEKSLSTFQSVCKLARDMLYYHPIIRKQVKKLYYEKILFTTEPTTKGKKDIDLYNINFAVKRIKRMPIHDIEPYVWLMALENEEKGMIKIKFEFPWTEGKAYEITEKDEIFDKLRNLYILSPNKSMFSIFNI